MRWVSKAFSLIELLIVAGLLMILSGIALSSYQSSYIRAQHSRVVSDLRIQSIAIESYHSDHSRYPRMGHVDFYGDLNMDIFRREPLRGNLSSVLSTPIAYIEKAHLFDPFMINNQQKKMEFRLYTYQEIHAYLIHSASQPFWKRVLDHHGPYRVGSTGPNQSYYNVGYDGQEVLYDPTNGLLSAGNIWRNAKNSRDMFEIIE